MHQTAREGLKMLHGSLAFLQTTKGPKMAPCINWKLHDLVFNSMDRTAVQLVWHSRFHHPRSAHTRSPCTSQLLYTVGLSCPDLNHPRYEARSYHRRSFSKLFCYPLLCSLVIHYVAENIYLRHGGYKYVLTPVSVCLIVF